MRDDVWRRRTLRQAQVWGNSLVGREPQGGGEAAVGPGQCAAGSRGQWPLRRWGVFLLLGASALVGAHVASASEDVKVLQKAPPRAAGCRLTVYRSDAEITDKYAVLCTLDITKSIPLTRIDVTGQALAAAEARACGCGANALILHYNSSDVVEKQSVVVTSPSYSGNLVSKVREYRPEETVQATAILFSRNPPQPAGPRRPSSIKPGFRGVGWGSTLDERFRPDEGVRAVTQVPTFVRPTDGLLVGDVPVTAIQYLAGDTGLAGVRITTDRGYWNALKDALDADWGLPAKCQAASSRCFWFSPGAPDPETVATLTESGPTLELLIVNPSRYLAARGDRRALPAAPRRGVQDEPEPGAGTALASGRIPTSLGVTLRLPGGFMGLKWGDPLFGDAAAVSQDGGKSCYERASDVALKRSLGAKGVAYCFVNGGLYDGTVTLDEESGKKLLARFSDVWGQPGRDGTVFQWETVDGGTVVRLTPGGGPGGGWALHSFDALFYRRDLGLDR